MKSSLALTALLGCLFGTDADLRSTIYAAVVARSGLQSNCSAFSSLFTPGGQYESPVGSGGVVGPAAIARECEAFNSLIGVDGSGWYPGPFFSSSNRSAFTLQIRTVGVGGCKVDLNGIVSIHYDTAADKLSSWQHHYDAVWDDVTLHGKCTAM